MRAIPVLLAILWTALFTWSFHNAKCNGGCCGDVDSTSKIDEAPKKSNDIKPVIKKEAITTAPLSFNKNNAEVKTSDKFASYRDSVLRTIDKNDLVKIIGHYYKDEKYSGEFDNLGVARADEVRKLFKDYLQEDQILLESKLLPGNSKGNTLLNSVSFSKEARKETISTVGNTTEIRFPYGSDRKLEDPAIEDYLSKVAAQVKKSGESITLTGHTDSESSMEFNQRLGMKRAQAIKSILVRKGVPSNKIKTFSKGETAPLASNSTEAGRQKNRRTELEIIK